MASADYGEENGDTQIVESQDYEISASPERPQRMPRIQLFD